MTVAMAVLTLAVTWITFPGRLGQERLKPEQPVSAEAQRAEISRLRKLLAEDSSIPASCGTRVALVTALVAVRAPARELVEAAGDKFCRYNPRFYYNLAAELNGREEFLSEALQYAEWSSLRYRVPNDAMGPIDSFSLIASIRIKRGEFDWVIKTFSNASPAASHSLSFLGIAYEKSNQIDLAIDAYIRSIGARDVVSAVPPGSYPNYTAVPDTHLKELYQKQHGTLVGLAEKIETARGAAWRSVYINPYRSNRPLVQWTLRDLDWRDVGLSNYEGKIVVLCFVPTDYEPILRNLKYLENLSEEYKDRGVVFLVVDVNDRTTSSGTRRQEVRDALQRAGITLTALLDEYGRVREKYTGATSGVVIIDRKHTQAFSAGPVSQELLPRFTKILDYLVGTVAQER